MSSRPRTPKQQSQRPQSQPRRVLHERSKSQNNERSNPSTPRAPRDLEDLDFFNNTPFPTKPEQVLSPRRPQHTRRRSSQEAAVSDVSSPTSPVSSVRRGRRQGKGKGKVMSMVEALDSVASAQPVPPSLPGSRSTSRTPSRAPSRAPVQRSRAPSSSPSIGYLADAPIRIHKDNKGSDRTKGCEPSVPPLPIIPSESSANNSTDDAPSDSLVDLFPDHSSDPTSDPASDPPDPHDFHAYSTPSEPSSDDVIHLPRPYPTIKPVHADSDSSPSDSPIDDPSTPSTPNVVRLGSTSPVLRPVDQSSPNFVRYGDSSPNYHHARSSSPNVVRMASDSSLDNPGTTSDGSLESSAGTVRRRSNTGGHWSRAVYRDTSELPGSSQYIRSSPPLRPASAFDSTDSFDYIADALSRPQSSQHPDSENQSLIEPGIDSTRGVTPARSWSGSGIGALNLHKRQQMRDPSSSAWTKHSSAAPSEWSSDQHNALSAVSSRGPPPPRPGVPVFGRGRSSTFGSQTPSMAGTNDERSDSLTEMLTHLRTRSSGFLPSLRSASRHNSLRNSMERPGSSGSVAVYLPGWARVFYASGNYDTLRSVRSQTSLASLRAARSAAAEANGQGQQQALAGGTFLHPPTPSGGGSRNGSITSRGSENAPSSLSGYANYNRLAPTREDPEPLSPADPRAHWAGIAETMQSSSDGTGLPQNPHDRGVNDHRPSYWSPHLQTDKREGGWRRAFWKAPTLSDGREKWWSLRNVQKLAFIVGFVFPLAWLIASFLPLPPLPILKDYTEGSSAPGQPDIEATTSTAFPLAELRYENAKWWRRVNRVMALIGVVVVIVVVVLAVWGVEKGVW